MEFGSDVLYASKAEEYEEIEELDYYTPPAPSSVASTPVKSTYKRKSNTKDDGQVSLCESLQSNRG